MSEAGKKYVSVKDDFLSKPLDPPDKVNLTGTRCRDCGEVFLGKVDACQQCQSENLEDVVLSRRGKLYSYTINWNRPPGDYKGPDNPYEPFAVGMVELPDGVIVLAALSNVKFDELKVGLDMELSIEELYKDADGNTVLTYRYKPVKRTKV